MGDSAAFNREVFQALQQKALMWRQKLAILRSYIQEMYNDSTQLPRVGKLFDVLIDQHPHEHDIHALYSRHLIVTQDYAKAAEQTERALDLDPADEEGWEMLTSLYLQRKTNLTKRRPQSNAHSATILKTDASILCSVQSMTSRENARKRPRI